RPSWTARGFSERRSSSRARWGRPCQLVIPAEPSAHAENPRSSTPAKRLTHRKWGSRSLAPRRETPVLKMSHHAAEPKKTPLTSTGVYRALGFGVPAMAENIAAKEAIVIGLVSVKARVDAQARQASAVRAAVASRVAGLARNVRMPRRAR